MEPKDREVAQIDGDSARSGVRRRYQTPRITEFGDVRTLTKGSGGSKPDFGHPTHS